MTNGTMVKILVPLFWPIHESGIHFLKRSLSQKIGASLRSIHWIWPHAPRKVRVGPYPTPTTLHFYGSQVHSCFFFLNNPWLCPTTSRGCCHHEASAVTALTMRCCFRARRRHAAHTASSSSPGSHRWSPSHNQSTWGGRAQPRRCPRAGTTAGGLLPLPLVQLELGGPPSCLTLGTHAVLF